MNLLLKTNIIGIAWIFLASGSCLDAALVALYRFEDNFTDSSGQGNHGTSQGATFATGQSGYGKAGSFGSGKYVTAADSSSLDITSTITIAAWVYRTGTSFDGIVAKNPSTGSTANYPGNYEFRVDSGAAGKASILAERTDTTALSSVNGTTTVGSGSWTHLAVTIASNGSVTHYFNGSVAGTGSLTNWGEVNNELLYIGNRKDLTTTPFDGLLDDVSIFNEVLTVTQINTIRSGDFTAFAVPESSSSVLIGLSVLGCCFVRRRSSI